MGIEIMMVTPISHLFQPTPDIKMFMCSYCADLNMIKSVLQISLHALIAVGNASPKQLFC